MPALSGALGRGRLGPQARLPGAETVEADAALVVAHEAAGRPALAARALAAVDGAAGRAVLPVGAHGIAQSFQPSVPARAASMIVWPIRASSAALFSPAAGRSRVIWPGRGWRCSSTSASVGPTRGVLSR